MAITKPPVQNIFADTGLVTPWTASELLVGWPDDITPPELQKWNWILNYLANGVAYLIRNGIVSYDAAQSYVIGSRVIGQDNLSYEALVAGILAAPPSASWRRAFYAEGESPIFGDVHLKAEDGSAHWVLQEQPDKILAHNRKNGKTYRLLVEEV